MTVRTLDSRPTIIIHVEYQSLRCHVTSFQNGHRNLSELRWRDYHSASSSTLFPAHISGSPHGGKPLGGGLAGTIANWLRWTKIREEHLQWQGPRAYLFIQTASLTCLKRTVAEGRQQCFFPLLASLIINLGGLHRWGKLHFIHNTKISKNEEKWQVLAVLSPQNDQTHHLNPFGASRSLAEKHLAPEAGI